MELDINNLISFFKKNTKSPEKVEFTEQEAAGSAPSGGGTTGGSTGPTMPKWADVVGGPKRGKANMLGKKGEKWNSGMNRGVANQIW